MNNRTLSTDIQQLQELVDNMKKLNGTKVENIELAVYECTACGFHLGIDATYLTQVGDVIIECPAAGCYSVIDTEQDKELT
jgi:hypothetical protein